MKRKILSILIVVGLIVGMMSVPAQAATEEEIEESIQKGVEWLAAQQQTNGEWSPGNEPTALTGFALVKLCDRAYELAERPGSNIDGPFDPDYQYSQNVIDGLDYLFSQAAASTVGICFAPGGHENYSTGIAMMAIAATRTPDAIVPSGPYALQTFKEVLQGCVDYMAWSQCDVLVPQRGGWGYGNNQQWADQSNTGYSVLGLRYAEADLYGFKCNIPNWVKPEHTFWVNYIQRPDGGADYDGTWGSSNLLRTGNLLFEQSFVVIPIGDPTVQAAIGYIQNNWNPGPDSQTIYCLMKGFESYGIETITVGGNPVDWFDDFANHIIANQHVDGYWDGLGWGRMLDTVFCLLTLEKSAPPRVIEVPVDIKPTSCPNPLNVGSKGVLPVAILGTEDFDVTQVDPASVRLEGVAPLRWALEDVATPYTGDGEGCYACTTEGPDGYLDLTLKFNMQEVVAALGEVNDGDCLVLVLTGNLMEEYDGTDIIGEDVVRIIKK